MRTHHPQNTRKSEDNGSPYRTGASGADIGDNNGDYKVNTVGVAGQQAAETDRHAGRQQRIIQIVLQAADEMVNHSMARIPYDTSR
jgi:hypothetical protein